MTQVSIGVHVVYQCDRCKRIMDKPAIGRGPNPFFATEHYCELCWLAVKEAENNPRPPDMPAP